MQSFRELLQDQSRRRPQYHVAEDAQPPFDLDVGLVAQIGGDDRAADGADEDREQQRRRCFNSWLRCGQAVRRGVRQLGSVSVAVSGFRPSVAERTRGRGKDQCG